MKKQASSEKEQQAATRENKIERVMELLTQLGIVPTEQEQAPALAPEGIAKLERHNKEKIYENRNNRINKNELYTRIENTAATARMIKQYAQNIECNNYEQVNEVISAVCLLSERLDEIAAISGTLEEYYDVCDFDLIPTIKGKQTAC